MGAGRRLLCFSIFIIITEKKWKDVVSLSLEMMPFHPCFSPQSPSCLCSVMLLCWLSFQAFIHGTALWGKKQQKETDLLLGTEEGKDGLKELNFWDSFFLTLSFFSVHIQALLNEMKLMHPLKNKCLIELDWDQNRDAEYVCCTRQ